jgi:tetratricopeptide (TPR) repeat protein
LLAKKDFVGALNEAQQAATLSPSDWEAHDLCGQALAASGDQEKAIQEFREANSLDPKQSQVVFELATALEKKGDWVAALEKYRTAKLTEISARSGHPGGEGFYVNDQALKGYDAAQRRFKQHLASLKANGKAVEAAELESKAQSMESAPDAQEKVQLIMEDANKAFQEQRYEDAERLYKQAVELSEKLPTGNESLIEALDRLGGTYGMRQKFTEAEVVLHREIAEIEKAFGPLSPRMANPLFALGSMAGGRQDFGGAEKYFSQILDINLKTFGENSPRTAQSLGTMAGLYMAQSQWEKAESYMLRATKATEASSGPEDPAMLMPLWGLCSLYDMWDKPEKSLPCWHRTSGIAEKQRGENSPELAGSLANEIKALRRLGRNDEADKLEQRSAKIQASATPN